MSIMMQSGILFPSVKKEEGALFKLIMELADVDTGKLIDRTFEAMKENPSLVPGGMKLPPFVTSGMLKMMPKAALVDTFAKSFNSDPEMMVPMLEQGALPLFGRIKLSKPFFQASPSEGVLLRAETLAEVDPATLFSRAYSAFPDDALLREITGEEGGESPRNSLMEKGGSALEYAGLKLLSTYKQELIASMEKAAKEKEVEIKIRDIRFLMPKG